MKEVIKLLGSNIKKAFEEGNISENDLTEIRIRINSPILIKTIKREYFLNSNLVTKKDIDETIASITRNSIHSYEKEIKNGFVTVEGGHRVGLGGDCIYEKDTFSGYKSITSLNIRIAKEFPGCSQKYLKYIISSENKIYNTLIIGPPLSGKTTLIRDITLNLSDGNTFVKGRDITLIDERGEISAVYNGVPQMNVGKRTDILSYCMKKQGFFLSIRSLSPSVIVTDELGSKDDFEIIQYASKSGVNILASAHGFNLEEIKQNIYLKQIIENNFFERLIVLTNKKNPGSVSEVYDLKEKKVIYSDYN